jgi:sugar phosphate isomerase/epimerase
MIYEAAMIPMLFSVSYAGYWGQHRLTLPEFFRKAANLGYPAVEVAGKRPHLSVLDYRRAEQVAAVRESAKTAGVEIATIAAYNDFTAGRHATEVPWTEMQLAYIEHLCWLAKGLGARIVRVFSGYFTEPSEYQNDWTKSVSALREAAAIAAEYGVVLGLQNHHDVGVSVEGYCELLDDVNHPNLRAMFDPWSPALHGADLYQAARRLAPRMVQTTLADYVKIDRFAYQPQLVNYAKLDPPAVRAVPLGDGFVDLVTFFRGLKDGGFNGYVCYEMCSPLRGGGAEANLDLAAKQSLTKIRELVP